MINFQQLLPDRRLLIRTMALSLAVCVSACYEEDMKISIDQRVPPTFTLAGSGKLVFFGIWEVSQENQNRVTGQRDGDKDTLLWKIVPEGLTSEEKVVRRLSPITYGSVPVGFKQKIPEQSSPPDLIEGKIYEAGGPAHNANGGFVWFTYKAGRIVKLDPPN